jgi:glycosyltransferase involved in cell wall biosynthesis
MSFDLIIFTFATGADGANGMNQGRAPLYHALARQIQGQGNVLVVTHWLSIFPDVPIRPANVFRLPFASRFQRMRDNLYVYTPLLFLPMGIVERIPVSLNMFRHSLGQQVRMAMRQAGMQNTIRVVTVNHPFHHYLLGLVEESLVVYDCLDEYSLYGGVSEPVAEVLALERQLTQKVDLVFPTSHVLYDKMRNQHANVHYFPNAVDTEFFHYVSQADIPVAPALSGIRRPIIGFMGNLTFWYDFALLRAIIQARPYWSYVFIGWISPYPTCVDNIRAIQSQPNVYVLGRQEFNALPSFLRGFDVAILPYQTSGAGPTVNPNKMYYYLAAGVPLVATPTPEIAQYGEVISLADNPTDFLRALEQRLSSGREDERVKQGIAIARENTWEKRTKGMLEIITAHLRAKTKKKSMSERSSSIKKRRK